MSDLCDLEAQLQTVSHNTDALQMVGDFSEALKKTKRRQEVFNAPGALLVYPAITYDAARERGLLTDTEDPFTLLQGDVVQTDTGYCGGERLTGMCFLYQTSLLKPLYCFGKLGVCVVVSFK